MLAAIVCFLRRKSAIGGWLLYFFLQTFLGAAVSIVALLIGLAAHNRSDSGVFYLFASLQEALAMIAVSAVCVALLRTRDWRWMVPLRAALCMSIGVGMISVAIDVVYFPEDVALDVAALFHRAILLAYFLVSKRVQCVFKTHDWDIRQGTARRYAALRVTS